MEGQLLLTMAKELDLSSMTVLLWRGSDSVLLHSFATKLFHPGARLLQIFPA